MILHAWYSAKMAATAPVSVYAREDGSEVVVTAVTTAPEYAPGWDDIVSLGEVVEFVRRYDTGAESWR